MSPTPSVTITLLLLLLVFSVSIAVIAGLALVPKARKVILIGLPLFLVPFVLYAFSARSSHQAKFEVVPVRFALTSGDVIGGGERWSTEFDRYNVADLYSSELQAIQSLALRCAVPIIEYTLSSATKRDIRFTPLPSKDNLETVCDILVQTLEDATGLRVVEKSSAASSIEVVLKEQPVGGRRGLRAFAVSVRLEGLEQNFVANFSTDKAWVRNEAVFRDGGSAPPKYFIAYGQPDGGDGHADRSPQAWAVEHLTPLVVDALPHTPGFASLRTGPQTVDRVADQVARRLTIDTFEQTFRSDVSGMKLDDDLRRSAILVDYSRPRLQRAIIDAVRDVRRSSYPRYDSGLVFAMGAIAFGVYGVLFGVSKFFDRRWPHVMAQS